jgi:hypothetical protein
MPWLAGIGVAVAAAVGAGAYVAAGSLAAMVIGGAVVGAAVGGLYAAFAGGNILKGVLYGAVGGAVIGGAGYAMGFGAAGAGAAGGTSTTVAATAGGQQVGTATMGTQFVAGQASVGSAPAAAAKAFTAKELIGAAGNVATFGAAFLKAGYSGEDRDAEIAAKERMQKEELASREKLTQAQIEAQLKAAGMQAHATMKGIASREKTAADDREEMARQFNDKLGWEKFTYGDAKAEEEKARDRQKKGITDASKYVSGQAQSVSLVQSNRQRRTLPKPVWLGGDSQQAQQSTGEMALQTPQQQAAPQTGILATGATA